MYMLCNYMFHLCFSFLFQSIYLSKYIDPGSFDNSVRKVLSKIMTNTLAQTYSFQGRGNKRKFEVLKTWELVQCMFLY